jgi:hypothetical protein
MIYTGRQAGDDPAAHIGVPGAAEAQQREAGLLRLADLRGLARQLPVR